MSTEPSLAYLLGRLAVVEQRVRRAVELGRAADTQPDDPFRGLYLSEEVIAWVLAARRTPLQPDPVADGQLARVEAAADRAAAAGAAVRLRTLADGVGLDPLEVELLLVALAPDLDSRFEQLYGYLNGDVGEPHAGRQPQIRLGPWSAHSFSRSSNFCTLPVEVLGSSSTIPQPVRADHADAMAHLARSSGSRSSHACWYWFTDIGDVRADVEQLQRSQ